MGRTAIRAPTRDKLTVWADIISSILELRDLYSEGVPPSPVAGRARLNYIVFRHHLEKLDEMKFIEVYPTGNLGATEIGCKYLDVHKNGDSISEFFSSLR